MCPKAVLFNTSPRPKGNTHDMLSTISEILEKSSIKSEIIQAGGKLLKGCQACRDCYDTKDMKCRFNDEINFYFKKMVEADVIILGSPTYFSDLTTEAKAIIDRCGYLNRANDQPLYRKIGAAVVPVRRAGGMHVFDSLNHFFLINNMIVPGSGYWNISIAREPGDYLKDQEGVNTMKQLAANICWLVERTMNQKEK